MKKQVDKSHYQFSKYLHKRRWASLWHQVDQGLRHGPERMLEIARMSIKFHIIGSLYLRERIVTPPGVLATLLRSEL